MLFSADAGYVRSAGDLDGHSGVHGAVRAGMHSGRGDLGGRQFGFEAGFRVKVADQVKQLAISESVVLYPLGFLAVAPYIQSGFHFLQFETIHDEFGFGMFSPYGEGGLMIRTGGDTKKGMSYIKLGASAEYDLRFTDQDSSAYYAFFVGWTLVGEPWPEPACGQRGDDPRGRCGMPPEQ